jgi:hypothetical protein
VNGNGDMDVTPVKASRSGWRWLPVAIGVVLVDQIS